MGVLAGRRKLELDERSQRMIEKRVLRSHPEIPVLGEEGTVGNLGSEYRWVVDPIDGTVNFAYGIPHACVLTESNLLQRKYYEPGHSASRQDAKVDFSPWQGLPP